MQEFPVPSELLPMDFGPGLDEALLGSREIASDALDGIKSEHGCRVLIRGMKMRPVVRCADLHEHSNHDAEKS